MNVVCAVSSMECCSPFPSKTESSPTLMSDLLSSFESDLSSNDYFFFYNFPATDHGRTVKFNVSPIAPSFGDHARRWVNNALVNVLTTIAWVETKLPSMRPLLHGSLVTLSSETTYAGDSHDILLVKSASNYGMDIEYYFPLERCREAISTAFAALENEPFLLNGVSAVRFIRAEDAYMSPFYSEQQDQVFCALDLFMSRAYDERLIEFADNLFAKFGGRPHWGKNHNLTADTVRKLYPKMDDFLAQREAIDPSGKFLNSHTRALLGL